MPKQLLRRHQVEADTGLSRSEIYRLMRLGLFPEAIPLGARAVAWDADEVQAWIKSRIDQRSRRAA